MSRTLFALTIVVVVLLIIYYISSLIADGWSWSTFFWVAGILAIDLLLMKRQQHDTVVIGGVDNTPTPGEYRLFCLNALYADYASDPRYNSAFVVKMTKDPKRYVHQAQLIKNSQADIICLQECAQALETEIIKMMPQYRSTGIQYHPEMVPPAGQDPLWKESAKMIRKHGYEGEVIIYNSSRLQLLGTRIVTSPTSIILEAEFQPLGLDQKPLIDTKTKEPKKFKVATTHVDWDDNERAVTLQTINKMLEALDAREKYILAGDFNANPDKTILYALDTKRAKDKPHFRDAIPYGPTALTGVGLDDEKYIDHVYYQNLVIGDAQVFLEKHPQEKSEKDVGTTPEGRPKNMLLKDYSDHAYELVDFAV